MPPGVSVISHREPFQNCHVMSRDITSGNVRLDVWVSEW